MSKFYVLSKHFILEVLWQISWITKLLNSKLWNYRLITWFITLTCHWCGVQTQSSFLVWQLGVERTSTCYSFAFLLCNFNDFTFSGERATSHWDKPRHLRSQRGKESIQLYSIPAVMGPSTYNTLAPGSICTEIWIQHCMGGSGWSVVFYFLTSSFQPHELSWSQQWGMTIHTVTHSAFWWRCSA